MADGAQLAASQLVGLSIIESSSVTVNEALPNLCTILPGWVQRTEARVFSHGCR